MLQNVVFATNRSNKVILQVMNQLKMDTACKEHIDTLGLSLIKLNYLSLEKLSCLIFKNNLIILCN